MFCLIWDIFKGIFLFILLALVLREIYAVYHLLRLKAAGNAYIYYFPVVGFCWNAIIRMDRKNEHTWFRELIRKADAAKKDYIATNSMFFNVPIIMPITPEMLKDFYQKELQICERVPSQSDPITTFGIFFDCSKRSLALRGIFTDIFSSENLRTVAPKVQSIVKKRFKLLKEEYKLKKTDPVQFDMNKTLAAVFLDILDEILFGYPDVRINGKTLASEIVQMTEEIFDYDYGMERALTLGITQKLGICNTYNNLKKREKELHRVIGELYTSMYNSNEADNSILGLMVKHNLNCREVGKGPILSIDDVVGNVYLFVFAAYDTSKHTSGYGYYYLSRMPELQDELYREVGGLDLSKDDDYKKLDENKCMDCFMKEVFRLGATGLLVHFRNITKDCEIGGVRLRKGDKMTLPVVALGTQEDFIDPYAFNPNRFLESGKSWNRMNYIPFSTGKRGCIGQFLASTILKVIFSEAVNEFKMECPDSFEPDVVSILFNHMTKCMLNVSCRR